MKLTHSQLRKIIKEVLVEVTDLNAGLYGSLEKAIAGSKFWLEGNTEDDGDYEDVPGLDLVHQTSAAQYLQDVLQATIDNAGEDIIIVVQSPELDANPGFLLTPDKPQYPDSVISGGYATITPDGKRAVVLNMSLFDDSFNDDDVNAQRIARKGAAILRHEIVHLQQVAARAKSEDISLSDAFENFRKEPKSIPPEGAGRQQYIKSHIEIDAHSHQAADELLSLYGKDEALRLISKTVDFNELGIDLPHAVEDYLIDNPSSKTARQFRKKVYEYIDSISKKIDELAKKSYPSIISSTFKKKITRSQLRKLISEAILSEIAGPSDKELLDLSNKVKADVLKYIDSPDLGTKSWKARIEKKINSIDSKNPSEDNRKIKFLKSLEPTSDDIIRKIKKDIWSIKPRMSNASETIWLLKKSADGAYFSETNEIIINTATHATLINVLSLEDILYHEFFHALDFVLGRVTGNTGRTGISFFSEEINLIINGEIKNNPELWRKRMIQMGATKFFLVGKTDKFIKREFEKATDLGHVNVYLRQLRRIFGNKNPIKKSCNLTFEEWNSLSDDIKMFVTMLSCTKEAQDAEDRIAKIDKEYSDTLTT